VVARQRLVYTSAARRMSARRTDASILSVALPVISAVALIVAASVAAQAAAQLTGVRLDSAFRLTGSDTSGLVVSVTISDQQRRRTSDDFALVLFESDGRRSGSEACLAYRVPGGSDPKTPWILLDGPSSTLSRSYRALIDAHTAIVEKSRKASIAASGRYEFVFLVGSKVKRAALAFGEDMVHRPRDLDSHLIGSFDVPWR
jgi:hypothetical protein